MGKPLSEDLIKMRGKTDNLSLIENLNLWGSELTDVSLIQEVPNVRILSLSVNHIDTLKHFASLFKLQELYMRRNNIKALSEIIYLAKLRDLRTLWLGENPVSSTPFYREFVIKTLPSLTKLDDKAITDDERRYAASLNIQDMGLPESVPSKANYEGELGRSLPENYPKPSRGPIKDNFPKKPTTSEFIEESDEDMGYRRNSRVNTYQNISENAFGSRNLHTRSIYQSHQNPLREQGDSSNNGPYENISSVSGRDERNAKAFGAYDDRNALDSLRGKPSHINPEMPGQDHAFYSQKRQDSAPTRIQNENILTAILVLMNELTPFEVQILKNECDKKLA